MKRTTRVLTLALLVASAGTMAAQEREAVRREDSGVTFDFQAADLRVVVSTLAEVAGLNIVYGDLPAQLVTLRTSRPVPVSEVRRMLENVARANGLRVLETDGLIRIEPVTSPEGTAAGAAAAAQAVEEERRLFAHGLRHAQAETVVRTLGTLFSFATPQLAAGQGGFLPLSQALREQRVAPFQEAQARPAAPPPEQEAETPPAEGEGQAVGLSRPVDMVADPLTNSILIMATPADYEIIQAAIDLLDVRPLQVLIEVLIAEVRRDHIRDLGVDVNVPLKEGDDSGVTFRLQGLSAGDVALGVLGIGNVNANVIIRALAADANVTILSRPVLLVQNNLEARILVGDQRPFLQVVRALPTENAVRDQVVQYRNVGTQLVIRPTIKEDGYVNLYVIQEVSNATNEFQFGAPVINTREVETQLLVKDGHTAVLGGLIDYQDEHSTSGIPILKDIPLLGAIFRSSQTRTVAKELVLLLTPHVLRTDEDLEEATRGLLETSEELGSKVPGSILFLDRKGVAPGAPPPPDSLPPPDSIPRPDSVPEWE